MGKELMQWLGLFWSVDDCRHVDLHSIWMMMGFHAVKSRQNETFHCHNQINIIMQTLDGKEGRKLSCRLCYRGANYLAIEMNFCVVLFRPQQRREDFPNP
jgi:hypothetical protein